MSVAYCPKCDEYLEDEQFIYVQESGSSLKVIDTQCVACNASLEWRTGAQVQENMERLMAVVTAAVSFVGLFPDKNGEIYFTPMQFMGRLFDAVEAYENEGDSDE